MRISTDHRATTHLVPVGDYRRAADHFVALAIEADVFDSVIVCGSLVKDDVVPGWSDLDLVCIAKDRISKRETLRATAKIYEFLTNTYHIGIGLDLAWRNEVDHSYRIGGRPLAMTYEVAQYGEFYINDQPFS